MKKVFKIIIILIFINYMNISYADELIKSTDIWSIITDDTNATIEQNNDGRDIVTIDSKQASDNYECTIVQSKMTEKVKLTSQDDLSIEISNEGDYPCDLSIQISNGTGNVYKDKKNCVYAFINQDKKYLLKAEENMIPLNIQEHGQIIFPLSELIDNEENQYTEDNINSIDISIYTRKGSKCKVSIGAVGYFKDQDFGIGESLASIKGPDIIKNGIMGSMDYNFYIIDNDDLSYKFLPKQVNGIIVEESGKVTVAQDAISNDIYIEAINDKGFIVRKNVIVERDERSIINNDNMIINRYIQIAIITLIILVLIIIIMFIVFIFNKKRKDIK